MNAWRQVVRARHAYLFLLPKLVVFVAFVLVPFVYTFVLTFQSGGVLQKARWVGLRNYLNLLQDQVFWRAMGNTLVYCAIAIPLVLALSVFVALQLNKVRRGAALFRSALLYPTLTSIIACALVWWYLLNTDSGPVNILLKSAGVTPPNWFGDPHFALPTVAIAAVWQGSASTP